MGEDHFQLFTSLRYDPALLSVPEAGFQGMSGWNFSKASSLYMLDYHRDRMLRAATYWGWSAAVAAISGDEGLTRLETYILSLPELGEEPLRVRVTLSKEGQFGYQVSPAANTPLSNLFPAHLPPPGADGPDADKMGPVSKRLIYDVVLDPGVTARSEFTHYKTTRRAMYDGARERTNISLPDLKEVLLVSAADGSIMEGSMTTPYFWRDGRWVTPPVAPRFSNDAGSGGQDGTTRRWALERGLCVEKAVLVTSVTNGEECWLSNGVRGFNFGKIVVQN